MYQMGSYYSLWVTDPYDLEIGSTKATFSTHTYTQVRRRVLEVHTWHVPCLRQRGQCSARHWWRASDEKRSEMRQIIGLIPSFHAYRFACMRIRTRPLAVPSLPPSAYP